MYQKNKIKKSLGQNFLIDNNVINKIIKIGNVSKSQKILEIGPGLGALTNKILEMNPAVIFAVEKDKNVYVVDSSNSDVTVFHSNGDYFKKAGYNSSEDTLSFMNEPVAVTVDQRGVVYVCDKGDGSIYRFKLSNTLDEDINPEN